jgi:alpha-tubulin suppressor-like RCC1 family protein
MVPGIDDAIRVACGSDHTCVLHEDGEMSCWGNNEYGQLGDGYQIDSPVPVMVQGL